MRTDAPVDKDVIVYYGNNGNIVHYPDRQPTAAGQSSTTEHLLFAKWGPPARARPTRPPLRWPSAP